MISYIYKVPIIHTVHINGRSINLSSGIIALGPTLRYGKVQSVRLRSLSLDMSAKGNRRAKVMQGKVDPERSTGNAYVVMSSIEAVEKALSANMMQVDGLHIRIDRAVPAKAKGAEGVLYDPARSLFVGNVHFQSRDEDLISLFSNASVAPELESAVEAVRIVRDPATNIGKGFAFVLFKTKAAARAALQHTEWLLRKRTLRLTKVTKAVGGASSKTVKPAGDFSTALKKEKAAYHAASLQKGAKPAAGSSATDGLAGKANSHGAVSAKQQPAKTGSVQLRFDVGAPAAKADWQGVRTKGKTKGVRGPKHQSPSSGANTSTKTSEINRKRDGKRPAVANRKSKAQLAVGNLSSSPLGFKQGSVKKKVKPGSNFAQKSKGGERKG
ncbi:hypothetical protein CEUSTIGMA_g3384.t1 [Chlamydomonas eustigma]|uniref:RRM domain-containing protein n=1 Tax=Chlamydomonas eustigma TaxID=1157962 RepID=A0A250WYN3_9CHLO|nr:hypothetical protein CEUSTIGMA_g3384.t1 [Chlamydomonas eustigma]|eukprot:GAX75941.1 hypothetical protein CEUSTIGMA_g3384.t1 [Chlamydomonas eustigma]